MLKKITKNLIALIVMTLILSLFSVISYAADAERHDVANFSDGILAPMTASKKTATGGYGVFKTETVDGVFRDYYNFGVVRNENTSASDEHIQIGGYRNFAGELEISFDIRYTDDIQGSMNFSLRQNGPSTNGSIGIISFTPSNCKTKYLSSWGSNANETLKRGVWYRFKVHFDIPNDTITLYRDGQEMAVVHNILTYSDKYKGFNFAEAMPRFQAHVSGTTVGNKVSFDIDNLELLENGSVSNKFFVTDRRLYMDVRNKLVDVEYIRNGKFQSKAYVSNKTTDENLNLTLAVGRYKASGEMIEMFKGETYVLKPGEHKDVYCNYTLSNTSKGEYIRTFIVDDLNNFSPIAKYCEYSESQLNPFGEEIVDAVLKRYPENKHPRILMDEEKLEYLAKVCYEQEPYKSWYTKIRNSANSIINNKFPVYDDLDELRLSSAGTVGSNITTLAFAYAIENAAGNPCEKYAKRIVDEMVNVSVENPEWQDWNPKHFLDTSAILVGYAYAYDWCYDYFNRPENAGEKEMMFNTLLQYGLNAADLAYNQLGTYWWTNANSNWNMVCNAGVAVAALAVCDEDEFAQLTPSLLEAGLKSAKKCFNEFAPDGAWFEGTGYWHYTVNLMSVYFGAMQTAAGSEYDYMSLPGIRTTGFFPIAMIGRNGSFNLNDAGASNISIPELWYFANQFGDQTLAKYRYYQLTQQGMSSSYKDILWYNEKLLGEDKDDLNALLSGMTTDMKYSGVEIATFRDKFFDEGRFFVGFHGGKNGVNHGHIDAGSFIYDARLAGGTETRWAIDIGSENYNLHNMFGGSDGEKSRWGYYRNRGEGHNTVIINPGRMADQPTDKTAVISDYKSCDEYGYAIIDMNPMYSDYTEAAHRGVYFRRNDGGLLVRDEITFKPLAEGSAYAGGNNLYWFMHTKADIEISEDGKSAILSQNNQRLWVGIIDGEQTFGVMDAVPLPTSPNPNEWEENIANDGSSTNPKTQNANKGIRKLVINDTAAKDKWELSVYMILLEEGEDKPSFIPENTTLENWN